MAAKPNLVKEWAQAVAKEQCQVIWDNDAVCHYFVEGGFVNWVDSWRERMDANSWCSAYAMCSKNDAYAPEPAADSCTSCKNFFGNYINIAKHNPKQFHDIFIQVTKNIFWYYFIEKLRIKFHLVIQILGRKRRLPRSVPGAWMHFHNERPKNRKNGRR